MPSKKLEHHKFFAPVAWAVCLSFAGYVGFLAFNLNQEINEQITPTVATISE